ncbi:MAG: SDR family oxidoreductase [Parvularculales bacterium]
MSQSRTAVVTGVSTGIGRAASDRLIKDGWHVFGSVRNEKDAEAAKDALGTGFTPLLFDVTDDAGVKAAAAQVSEALDGRTLDGLVNNAGIAVAAPLRYVPVDDLRKQFDVNVYGPIRVTQAFLPLLGADDNRTGAPGKIINIGSVSGKLSTPFMAPYSMSKFAVEAMSDAMRMEFLPHGIDVVVVEPGPVKTPIFAKTEELDFSRYGQTEYAESLDRFVKSSGKTGKKGLEPSVVGDLILQIFNNPSPKTRYAVMKNKFTFWTIPRLMPSRRLDKALAGRMGLKRRNS